MHAPYWNDDALRETFRDLLKHPDEQSGDSQSWSESLEQHRESCSAEDFAAISAAIKRYDAEGPLLHQRWAEYGSFSMVHGNFHPLQLRFPHQLEGPASPAKARCDGGVLSMDWRSCGVGMPVRDLFMALVPWMTYLPREFRGEQEKKLVELYHRTLLQEGVRGFPKSQLWQEYALTAIDFVPRLFELIEFGKSEPVGQLLHCAADFDFTAHLLLSYADTLTRHEAVDFCRGVQLGGPTLIRAFQLQDLKLVNKMLDHGYPNINEVDIMGICPLAYAVYLGDQDMLDLVLAQSPSLNRCSRSGVTPLTLATKHNRTGIALKLIQAGAEVDLVTGEQKFSALIYAACNGDLAVVGALVDAGADIGLRCAHGKTALDYAEQENRHEVATLLGNSMLSTHTTATHWCHESHSPLSGLLKKVNTKAASALCGGATPEARSLLVTCLLVVCDQRPLKYIAYMEGFVYQESKDIDHS
eukprot:TRINITY_DN9283_c0_g2_i1.p1 TRINITY_DN9283_c0_g2~~TRINITY_DN9283_c0_g2_i1.p1  ORF type:complete len:471 (-),score=104.66 TRINITY_DN9283_c0_g2_i1:207-1619(-)